MALFRSFHRTTPQPPANGGDRLPRRRVSGVRAILAATLLVALPVAVAACASTSDAGTSQASAGGDAFLEKATATVQAAAAPITAEVPATGPQAAKGKTLVLMPCSAAAQGCQAQID